MTTGSTQETIEVDNRHRIEGERVEVVNATGSMRGHTSSPQNSKDGETMLTRERAS